jgi:hypothetical protein
MEVLVLKKEIEEVNGLSKSWIYLIANGDAMGKWTAHFGVHCLTDTPACKKYIQYQHEKNKDSIIEIYTIIKKY